MTDSIRRRSLLTAVATVSFAGCTALGDPSDDRSDDDLEDDDVQEASSDDGSIEVVGSEILDEDQLLEISVRTWGEFGSIRYLDGEDLEEIEPDRDRWLQLTIDVNDLRDVEISERLEIPGVEEIEAAAVESGEVLEPVSWAEMGLESDQIRDDVRSFEEAHTPAQGDSTWVAPLFDAPREEIAVDIGPILEAEDSIFLR